MKLEDKYELLLKDFEMFAHTTSHDLRDPLRQAIEDCKELLEKTSDNDSKSKINEIIDNINLVITRVAKLREYSYLVQQKGEATEFEVSEIIEEIKKELIESGAEFSLEYKEMPKINANRDAIKLLFKNLIENAINFKSDDEAIINISAEKSDDKWQFSIADNGQGIENVYRNFIFTIFQKLDPESKKLGTGLSFCKKIVENHDGEIWFESDGENGTKFVFTILG